ncbi:MAG TPA: pyrroloquinoline quinone-dependent dehydrogenase [Vicinamibacterales bacterium]|nr:pyrroloquinoline quinone-dependent dehydrogenase [Vicinamibacterales bacterium]
MKNRLQWLSVVAIVVGAAWTVTGKDDKNHDWPAYSGDKASTKYSPLDQINKDTVGKLQIVWRQSGVPEELKAAYPGANAPGNWQNTPLMVDGLLYMSSGVGTVVALDAATGKVVWFDVPPSVDGKGPARGGSSRSVAYWANGNDSRIFTMSGANLIALNAKTGKRYPDWGTNGAIDLTKVGYDRGGVTGYRNSSGPIVVRDVIVVGGVPAPATDYLSERVKATKEAPPDDIRGFDAKTGKLLWTFHVVPRPGEFGEETWLNGSAAYSGNSGVWSLLSADEELGYVYLPLEEATGDYFGGTRPGNNLFAESILCLDAKTGKRVWHFQTLHHGIWDYDLPAAPILGDIKVNGRTVKAIAQVSKQAYVYVLDRVTGKPIWPIEERPVPKGEVPGEWYSPTQPIPTKPPAFDQQGVTDKDLIDYTPELKAEARKIVDEYNYGPLFTPAEVVGTPKGKKGTIYLPGTNGGADWGGAAFDPETGVLYVPSTHMPDIVGLVHSENTESNMPWVKRQWAKMLGPQGLPDPFKPPYARLTAIDLNKGEILWQVANGDGLRNHPAFKGLNLPPIGTPGRNAAIVTKTLVFMGEGSDSGVGVPAGFGGKMFRAFDKKTGKIVWEKELPAGVSNSPMTYMVNGKQYVLVAVSGRQFPGEYVALALP